MKVIHQRLAEIEDAYTHVSWSVEGERFFDLVMDNPLPGFVKPQEFVLKFDTSQVPFTLVG